MKPKCAVGSAWEYISPKGSVGRVWLRDRYQNKEFWHWSFHYADGSRPFPSQDWTPNRQLAVEECRTRFAEEAQNVRFKKLPYLILPES